MPESFQLLQFFRCDPPHTAEPAIVGEETRIGVARSLSLPEAGAAHVGAGFPTAAAHHSPNIFAWTARAAGIESEMELPFAGLHQFCMPFLDRLATLPGPQREALGTVFGLHGGGAPDRFLVGLAVLSRKRPGKQELS